MRKKDKIAAALFFAATTAIITKKKDFVKRHILIIFQLLD